MKQNVHTYFNKGLLAKSSERRHHLKQKLIS